MIDECEVGWSTEDNYNPDSDIALVVVAAAILSAVMCYVVFFML